MGSEAEVRGGDVVVALLTAAVIAVLAEVGNGWLEVAGKAVGFEQD